MPLTRFVDLKFLCRFSKDGDCHYFSHTYQCEQKHCPFSKRAKREQPTLVNQKEKAE